VPEAARAESQGLVKCLVWDLDGTLWDGTLLEGDDVRPREGAAQVIAELDARGILQSICSRNDHQHAWQRLRALGLDHYFVYPQIGFGRKSDAVRRIADRLQFDLGTIAFIDDEPSERAEVLFHLPQVRCYAADQMTSLTGMAVFRPPVVTADARRRRQLYQAGQERDAEQAAFTGSDEEFLRSLGLKMHIVRASDEDLGRAAELTVRTSQMNATGLHYREDQLRVLRADPGQEILVVSLTDRFGPYGTVGVALLGRHPAVWHLKLLATSCRVMPCGAGAVILNWLTGQAARAGVHVVADFRATSRNRIAELAYRFAGLGESSCACQATIAPTSHPDIQRFHTDAAPETSSTTMRVEGPELSRLAYEPG
jgi:methoxymalonate biosynthesis protein